MKPVQLILIAFILIGILVYFNRLRSGIFDRVLVLLFGAFGVSMLIFPEWTNWLAHSVGVDSGAHLFIYLAILGLGFFCLLLYSRIRDIHAMITDLVRKVAIERGEAEAKAARKEDGPPSG